MRKALDIIASTWDRYRVFIACLMLILGGAMGSWVFALWYFQQRLDNQYLAMNATVQRLQADVDYERALSKHQLFVLGARLGDLMTQMEQLAPKVEQASRAATKAAVTADSAADNAAKANIRIREIPLE